ncbi:MAG TPA: peptide-methionine (S)-S-oxide reductase MsrA, partial [Candidatus Obscuribacter sp.]|nr:peptide-methionine (S)-S-oxide reductase MsrA [Candidatus Obscuribacter sp.]
VDNPHYRQVCTDTTGHAEAVLVEFDPSVVSYKELLAKFFSIHDPTTLNYQGPDHGSQYRSAIFYENEEQRVAAEEAKLEAAQSGPYKGRVIVTEIVPAQTFWRAEEYHQDYFKKHGAVCH